MSQSKKTGDLYEDTNADVSRNGSLISYSQLFYMGQRLLWSTFDHSRVKDKNQTSSSTKSEIKNWLQKRNLPFLEDLRKLELYQLICLHKTPQPAYVVVHTKAAEYWGLKLFASRQYVARISLWGGSRLRVQARACLITLLCH